MSNIIKLGVDNGNFNTKSSEHMCYLSGFTKSDQTFITPDQTLFYNNAYYAIGSKRMNLQQDKTADSDTFILTLPAIANAMKIVGVQNADIILGVGLPLDVYGGQKQRFREYFLNRGEIHFRYEGILYHCCIRDCKVFAQGHAALCQYFPALKGYRSVTIVDIGGYTVDVLPVHSGKPDQGNSLSLPLGTIYLFHAIEKELQKRCIRLTEAQMFDAIQGQIQHADKSLIENVIRQAIKQYRKELLNALREHDLDLRAPTVFAGGGAELLKDQLKTSELTTVTILDRFANADGYKLLLG